MYHSRTVMMLEQPARILVPCFEFKHSDLNCASIFVPALFNINAFPYFDIVCVCCLELHCFGPVYKFLHTSACLKAKLKMCSSASSIPSALQMGTAGVCLPRRSSPSPPPTEVCMKYLWQSQLHKGRKVEDATQSTFTRLCLLAFTDGILMVLVKRP